MELDERRIGRPTSGAAVAAQWFAQDLFNNADVAEEEEEDQPQSRTARKQKVAKGKPTATSSSAQDNVTAPVVAAQLQGAEAVPAAAAAAGAAAARLVGNESAASSSADSSDSSLPGDDSSRDEDSDNDNEGVDMPGVRPSMQADDNVNQSGFEEVPVSQQHAGGSANESSDDGFSDLDDDGRAEVLALAKKMLKGRDRQDIMDNAYHKYAFHETGLPRWFEEDEKRHMK